MRKSIAVAAALLLFAAAPATGHENTPKAEQVITTVHTNVNVLEGGATGEKTLDVAVDISPGPAGNTYAVDYEVVPVSASRGSDFDATIGKGKLTIDGSKKATIPIKIKGDVFDELNETVRIDLFNERCTGSGECDLDSDPNPEPGFVTIVDDDGKETPGPEIDIQNGFADRSSSSCNVTVVLDYGSAKKVTVDFETEDLEATHNDDYESTEGTMTLSPGQIRKPVKIALRDDREQHSRNDRIVVNFSRAKGGHLAKSSGVCNLSDRGQRPEDVRPNRP
jgi:Calx-beta domain-containing protein